MANEPRSEIDSKPTTKKKITEREWFLPVVLVGFVAPVVVGIVLYHYEASFDRSGVAKTSQTDSRNAGSELNESAEARAPELEVEESPPTGVDSELSDSLEGILDSYRETSQQLIDNLSEQARQRTTFAYLEGSAPTDNYSVFLQKYYGLNDNPQLGDGLIESLIGKEVEWALKVHDIFIDGNAEVAYMTLSPNLSVCEGIDCPENFQSRFIIHVGADSKVIYAVKKDDFIHIRGLLASYPPESAPNSTYRERMHVHVSNFRYYATTDGD